MVGFDSFEHHEWRPRKWTIFQGGFIERSLASIRCLRVCHSGSVISFATYLLLVLINSVSGPDPVETGGVAAKKLFARRMG